MIGGRLLRKPWCASFMFSPSKSGGPAEGPREVQLMTKTSRAVSSCVGNSLPSLTKSGWPQTKAELNIISSRILLWERRDVDGNVLQRSQESNLCFLSVLSLEVCLFFFFFLIGKTVFYFYPRFILKLRIVESENTVGLRFSSVWKKRLRVILYKTVGELKSFLSKTGVSRGS